MALFLDMDDVRFKPQAYEKAAYSVTALDRPLAAIHAEGGAKALDALPVVNTLPVDEMLGLVKNETSSVRDKQQMTVSRY